MFLGFSEKTQDFLWGVRLNNERPWFEAHKQEYLDNVQTPLRALGEEVYEKFLDVTQCFKAHFVLGLHGSNNILADLIKK